MIDPYTIELRSGDLVEIEHDGVGRATIAKFQGTYFYISTHRGNEIVPYKRHQIKFISRPVYLTLADVAVIDSIEFAGSAALRHSVDSLIQRFYGDK
jgi:hypothetical protein